MNNKKYLKKTHVTYYNDKNSTSENISTHCTTRDPHFQANSRRRKLLHLIMPHVPLSSSAHRGISSTKRQHQGHALIYIDVFFFPFNYLVGLGWFSVGIFNYNEA